jgi:fucose permease
MTGSALFAASFVPSFPFFLMLSLPLGLGSGAIDVGMSYYVAHHFTSRHMSWLHGSWGIGATLGPSIVTLLIGLGLTWRAGYAVIGSLQLLLAIAFLLTLPLWNDGKAPSQDTANETRPVTSEKAVMSVRFWTCALMFFVYCSIENSVGLWGYQLLTRIHDVSEHIAGYFVSCFWGGLMVGRFLIGSIANRVGNRMLIRISTIGVMTGGLLLIVTHSQILVLLALLLVGFSFATIYPSMMHETPRRFNRATAVTLMGFQSGAGVMGFGLSPSMVGFVAARTTFGILPYLILTFGLLLFCMQVVVDGWKLTNKPEE